MRFISTLLAVALIAPVTGFSQTSAPDNTPVDVGSRVRIAAPVFGTKAKQVGTVLSVTPDTVVLRFAGPTSNRSLAASDIASLEVFRGTHTRKAKGALWGLLIGAGGGAILGYTLYEEPTCNSQQTFGCFYMFGPDSPGTNAALSAGVGGIFGALIGTLVGSRAIDTWVPATLAAR